PGNEFRDMDHDLSALPEIRSQLAPAEYGRIVLEFLVLQQEVIAVGRAEYRLSAMDFLHQGRLLANGHDRHGPAGYQVFPGSPVAARHKKDDQLVATGIELLPQRLVLRLSDAHFPEDLFPLVPVSHKPESIFEHRMRIFTKQLFHWI